MIHIIIYDFEVFRYDWLLCYVDTDTRSSGHIVNDKAAFEAFYSKMKNKIWVGYNSRSYDQWIAKAILCGFDPYKVSEWIIVKERKGFEFSRLLSNFTILNYDCTVGFRSLKELEAFMGHDIRETPIPFDIDRKLTVEEIREVLQYCEHDVNETFEVFLDTIEEFTSHTGLIREFDLPVENISKTKAQLSAIILGAVKKERNDEFDIRFPDVLSLGKYSFIADFYMDWAKNSRNYDEMSLRTKVFGVEHTFGIGGIHGSVDNYFGDGDYLMADVASFYPAIMIEYGMLSRNVFNPSLYKKIRDDRLVMKAAKDPREKPRKIVLNGTFGASKDPYNNLYDPCQANNVCIAGQLLLVDLMDKLECCGGSELIQSNTDGILIKIIDPSKREAIDAVFAEWCKRTRMVLEFDKVKKVIQRDVNNYIIVKDNGKIKRKGAVVKELKRLDNDLPIVNEAVVKYFILNRPVDQTVYECNDLIKFQKITKVGQKYEHAHHNGKVLTERVNRCFASLDINDTTLSKKHRGKTTLDKVAGTPEHCFIMNGDITKEPIPAKLDKEWYVNEAKKRIKEFI